MTGVEAGELKEGPTEGQDRITAFVPPLFKPRSFENGLPQSAWNSKGKVREKKSG